MQIPVISTLPLCNSYPPKLYLFNEPNEKGVCPKVPSANFPKDPGATYVKFVTLRVMRRIRIFKIIVILLVAPVLFIKNLNSAGTIVGFALMPNPFTPNGDGLRDALHIKFQTAESGEFVVRIFNVTGEEIITLASSQTGSGNQSWDVTWDGKDGEGNNAPSGVYFILIDFNGTRQTTKAVLRR